MPPAVFKIQLWITGKKQLIGMAGDFIFGNGGGEFVCDQDGGDFEDWNGKQNADPSPRCG